MGYLRIVYYVKQYDEGGRIEQNNNNNNNETRNDEG